MRKSLTAFILVIIIVLFLISGCSNRSSPADNDSPVVGDNNSGEVNVVPGQQGIDNYEQDSAFSEKELEGLLVVYENQGSIFIAEGYRSLELLVEGVANEKEYYQPLLSPDGKNVIFHYKEYNDDFIAINYELRIINIDGSDEKVLINQGEMAMLAGVEEVLQGDKEVSLAVRNLAWLPQSGKLAFQTYFAYSHFWHFQNDLWLVDPANGAITRILEKESCGKYAFSPDEKLLIISDVESLTLMNADGTNRQELITYPIVSTDYEYYFYPQPRWAPDGSYALVAVSGPDPFLYERSEAEETSIWRISPDGETEKLYSINWPGITELMNGEIFSPDSKKMLHVDFEGRSPKSSKLLGLDGQELASFGSVTKVCGWSTDSAHLILKNDQDLLVGIDGSILSLNIDGEPAIWNICWVSPSIFVASGFPGSSTKEMIWIGNVEGKVKVISDSFNGVAFDAMMIR